MDFKECEVVNVIVFVKEIEVCVWFAYEAIVRFDRTGGVEAKNVK